MFGQHRGGQPRGVALHLPDHAGRREHRDAQRAADVGEQRPLHDELLLARHPLPDRGVLTGVPRRAGIEGLVQVDPGRGHGTGQHHVLPDHHQELDHLARREERPHRGERLVARADLVKDLCGEREHVALLIGEALRLEVAAFDRLDLLVGRAHRPRDRDVLHPLVVRARAELRHPKDGQLAKQRIERQVVQQHAAPPHPRPEGALRVRHQPEHVQGRHGPQRLPDLRGRVVRVDVRQPRHRGRSYWQAACGSLLSTRTAVAVRRIRVLAQTCAGPATSRSPVGLDSAITS